MALEMTGTLRADCAVGEDVNERRQNGTQRVPTWQGWKTEPKWERTYLTGDPFGGMAQIVAPIALKVSDEIIIDAENGAPLCVIRNGKAIWQADDKRKEKVTA